MASIKEVEFNIPAKDMNTHLKSLSDILQYISSIKVFVKKTYRKNPDDIDFKEFFHDIPKEQLLNDTLKGYNYHLIKRHAKNLVKHGETDTPYGIMKIVYIIDTQDNKNDSIFGGSRKSIKPSRKPSRKTSKNTSRKPSRKPSRKTSRKPSRKSSKKKRSKKKRSKKKHSKKN